MRTTVIEGKQRIESVISQADACFVGITDLEDNPYVVPTSLSYENGTFYLHLGPKEGKMEMLQRNNSVRIVFSLGHRLVYQRKRVACSHSMCSKDTIYRGKVELIKDTGEKRHALDITMRRYTKDRFSYSDPAVRNVKVWKVPVDQMAGKVFGLRADGKP